MAACSVFFKDQNCGSVPLSGTLRDLKAAVGALIGLSPSRVELRATDPAKDREAKEKDPSFAVKRFEGELKGCEELGLTKATRCLFVKDLGPQIGYRTVFYVEYAGPIFIVLLAMLRGALPVVGPYFFGGGARPVDLPAALTRANLGAAEASREWARFVQALAIAMWLAHFVKRELESAFVHKFSRPTMPFFNM